MNHRLHCTTTRNAWGYFSLVQTRYQAQKVVLYQDEFALGSALAHACQKSMQYPVCRGLFGGIAIICEGDAYLPFAHSRVTSVSAMEMILKPHLMYYTYTLSIQHTK